MKTTSIFILLNSFNETIDVLIGSLKRYSLSEIQQQPMAGSWSLGQMYTHILDDTEYYIEQIKAALSTNDNSDKPMHENAAAMFAQNAFPDIKIEGPATNMYIPQPENKEALMQRLISIRETINTLFFSIDETKTPGKTQHPGLLYFNAQEWLQFAEMHIRHHFSQQKRIEAALGL